MENKRLVLIRHAHRDTEIHTLDNGLSDKGKKQVKQVVRFSLSRDLNQNPKNAIYLSSPKKRCIETITPLAEEFGAKVKIEPSIGEGASFELYESFIDWWKNEAPELTVACSHGDVIPILVQKLTGATIAIKKAGWCEIELVGKTTFFTWLVQKYE